MHDRCAAGSAHNIGASGTELKPLDLSSDHRLVCESRPPRLSLTGPIPSLIFKVSVVLSRLRRRRRSLRLQLRLQTGSLFHLPIPRRKPMGRCPHLRPSKRNCEYKEDSPRTSGTSPECVYSSPYSTTARRSPIELQQINQEAKHLACIPLFTTWKPLRYHTEGAASRFR